MAEIVAELHVPLRETPGLAPGAYRFPWIEDIEDFLAVQEDVEVFDDGEEFEEHYLFFLTGTDEEALLDVAERASHLPRVPPGAFVMMTDSDTEQFGLGRRVDLPPAPAV